MQPPLPADALVLAPMVSLSHRALRELILRFGGMDLAFTEMASAGALVSESPYDAWYLDAEPEPAKTILQFYTTKPGRLAEALAMVADKPVFGVDINFGCAAPHIKRAGGGAAWMREPEKARDLVALARAAWPRNLSAKLRIGPEEDYGALRDFAQGLIEAGIDFLTLHPRLEDEKFRRKSRWDYVGRLAAELPVPVLGNGDVRSFSDWTRRRTEAAPAGVMLGREAVRRPWIFALLRGREASPDFALEVKLRDTAFDFLDLLEARLPADMHLTRARKFFFYYADNATYAHHLRWKLQNAPDLPAMRTILDAYFEEVPQDRVRLERD
ncbi:MAG: tRNA-dihydrouridine synthase family protein [Spirochaetaceae bacterium]|nr:tRNA-dihydrouridine synthase family protein [Spirochaetaceae bacterium]